MLKTRHREKKLFECCLEIQQPFVIDNTNLSRQERQRYIPIIQQYGVELHGYYFASQLKSALERNAQRGQATAPDKAILSAHSRLELPSYDEGFTKLYYVNVKNGIFEIKDWEQ
jgi:predicted kinase